MFSANRAIATSTVSPLHPDSVAFASVLAVFSLLLQPKGLLRWLLGLAGGGGQQPVELLELVIGQVFERI
jgi:hypothetical protein